MGIKLNLLIACGAALLSLSALHLPARAADSTASSTPGESTTAPTAAEPAAPLLYAYA